MENEDLQLIWNHLKNENLPRYKKNQLLAIEKHLLNYSTTEIAKELDMHPRSIQRYIRNYKEKGLEAIMETSKPGNSRRLDDSQLNKIKEELQKYPSHHGYFLPKWTAKLVRKHIKKAYGVSLSEESCRKILQEAGVEGEWLSAFKQRNLFKEQLNTHLSNPNIEVWIISDIYLGIRERRKNKQGKLPYYPDDLLKDPSTIPKVDLTQKAKGEWILCLEAMKSGKFFYLHHTDQQEEGPRYKEAIQQMFRHTKVDSIVLLLPNAAIHRRNLLKLHSKRPNINFLVQFIPTDSQDLNPLNQRKEDLIEMFRLKKKGTNERKILSEQKMIQIIKYLDEISSN
jgi:transposase